MAIEVVLLFFLTTITTTIQLQAMCFLLMCTAGVASSPGTPDFSITLKNRECLGTRLQLVYVCRQIACLSMQFHDTQVQLLLRIEIQWFQDGLKA